LAIGDRVRIHTGPQIGAGRGLSIATHARSFRRRFRSARAAARRRV
jgi:hypothetical protein